jgi:lipopolysaccharide export system permease protein
MKTLDRYVVATFVKNYLISFFVLVGMYVLLDMVFNFDELVEVQERAGVAGFEGVFEIVRAAGDYYLYQLPVFFVHLSGMIPVVAAAFTLIRLSRFNELSAMLSAGVPLLRIASPIIICALVLNGLLLLDQELLIPAIIPKLSRERQDAGREETSAASQIAAMQDENNGVLNVARYKPDRVRPVMYEFTLIERNEQLKPVGRLVARKAEWDQGTQSWRLTEGKRITGLLAGTGRKIENNVPAYKSNITPEEVSLYSSGKYVEWLPTRRIDQLLERPQQYGALALQRVKHTRFTQPLVNVILLLLAIPCVMTREPTRLKAAATQCLLLTGACLAVSFLAQQMSGQPPYQEWAGMWPAVMAWLPILIFGPVAVFLLDRVET